MTVAYKDKRIFINCDSCGQFVGLGGFVVKEEPTYSTEPPYTEPELKHYCRKCEHKEGES